MDWLLHVDWKELKLAYLEGDGRVSVIGRETESKKKGGQGGDNGGGGTRPGG